MCIPYDWTWLLGRYSKEMLTQIHFEWRIIIIVLFVLAKKLKLPKCPSVRTLVNKIQSYSIEYYIEVKMNFFINGKARL